MTSALTITLRRYNAVQTFIHICLYNISCTIELRAETLSEVPKAALLWAKCFPAEVLCEAYQAPECEARLTSVALLFPIV